MGIHFIGRSNSYRVTYVYIFLTDFSTVIRNLIECKPMSLFVSIFRSKFGSKTEELVNVVKEKSSDKRKTNVKFFPFFSFFINFNYYVTCILRWNLDAKIRVCDQRWARDQNASHSLSSFGITCDPFEFVCGWDTTRVGECTAGTGAVCSKFASLFNMKNNDITHHRKLKKTKTKLCTTTIWKYIF